MNSEDKRPIPHKRPTTYYSSGSTTKNKRNVRNTGYFVIIFILSMTIFAMFLISLADTQAQDIQVLETKIDMQIVKSEDGLYYIQCIDSCKEWYATGDVGELFQGFLLSCEAMNFWKLKWHETYGGVYIPLECEFSWG